MKYPDKEFVKEMSQLIKSILTFCDYKIELKNGELIITCAPKDLNKVILFFKDNPSLDMSCLIDIAGVDYPENAKRFTIVYNLLSMSKNFRIKVKTSVSEDQPISSITDVFPSADWYEREIWDLFGVRFSGHKDLRRILTDYDFDGFPLRKDFPLSGFVQFKYDDEMSRIVSEPVKLDQEYRDFDNLSPWEGMTKDLPGDEKSSNLDNDKN